MSIFNLSASCRGLSCAVNEFSGVLISLCAPGGEPVLDDIDEILNVFQGMSINGFNNFKFNLLLGFDDNADPVVLDNFYYYFLVFDLPASLTS